MSEANEECNDESLTSRCSAVAGTAAALKADVQRMADILAQWQPQTVAWLNEADVILCRYEDRDVDNAERQKAVESWSAFLRLRDSIEEAMYANQRILRAVMDGKLDAIR